MKNHVTPDGLMAAIECTRPIRYRGHGMIIQDACEAEPRLDLILNPYPDDPAGQGYSHVQLDVATATHLMNALREFLAAHIGLQSWRHDGVYYSLEHAWEGRPGTGYDGWFRWTGESREDVPVMMAITGTDPQGNTEARFALLPQLLGLAKCPTHNIWSAPCHACVMDGVREVAPEYVRRSHP